VAFKKKFQTHPPKPAEAKPSFRKVSLPPAKLRMLSSLTSGLESFGHKPTHRPWIEAFLQYLGQGTLGCDSLSSLLFRHFSSPTNIHTHSS